MRYDSPLLYPGVASLRCAGDNWMGQDSKQSSLCQLHSSVRARAFIMLHDGFLLNLLLTEE